MKIGIIGSGNMGRVLGLLWMEKGHSVFFGSQNEKSLAYVQVNSDKPILSGTLQQAVQFGDVLFYTLRDRLPADIADLNEWNGKIVIDCNNGTVPEDFIFGAVTSSYAEMYQANVPGAFIVKAFNTLAQEVFQHDTQTLKNAGAAVYMAGDDVKSKQIVSGLIHDTGLDPIDMGGLGNSKMLESLADFVRYNMIRNQAGPFYLLTSKVLPTLSGHRFGDRQPTKYK